MARAPRRRRQGGQSMVEFALVAIVLFPLLVGFFDVGRAVHANNSIASAARQGARYASINCVYEQSGSSYSAASVTTWMQKQDWGIDRNAFTVTVSPSTGSECVQPGVPITVTLHYKYVPVTPIFAQMASAGIDLTGAATIQSQ